MNSFLNQLANNYNNYKVLMILDKAGWHVSQTVALPEMLSSCIPPLIPPKLKTVELLWREIRANYFKNRIFDTLDAVEETLLTGLAAYYNNKEAVINLSKGFCYFNKVRWRLIIRPLALVKNCITGNYRYPR
jgi:hypothetical protein